MPPVQSLSGFDFRETGPASSRLIVALHGSGADETTMLPLAAAIDPAARIISLRGRIDQNGERRWFRKITPTEFEQASILSEAEALAAFLRALGADPSTLFLGYSNGGNLVHAAAMLHPGAIRQAALLRCMPVLHPAPHVDLAGSRFLVLRGRDDTTYGPFGAPLVRLLRSSGAQAALRTAPAGHLFGPWDAATVRRWQAAATG